MSKLLTNKICLVTGATRGIGKSVAIRFAEEGAIVYANVRENSKFHEWHSAIIEEYKDRIIPRAFDVCDRAALKDAILNIKKTHNRLDVLVNNAGVAFNEKIGMISYENMKKMFEVNVYAPIELLQLAARVMQRQGGGSIINISSMVGVNGDVGQCGYSASKGAIIAATKSAAKELAPMNIRVNSVAPGLTETDMLHGADMKNIEERISNIGMKRIAKPIDIANACVFLASDLSEYVTGQIIGVDGSAKI